MLLSIILRGDCVAREFVCMETRGPVVIDGALDEWRYARSISFHDEFKRKSDNHVEVWSMWDEDYLYFAFDIKDSDLRATQTELDHPQLYLDDMVEFLLDPLIDRDSCWAEDDIIYHINILGQKKDDRGSRECITNPMWNGHAIYAITIDGSVNDSTDIDNGYIVEVSIAWDEVGVTPVAGLVIGVNLANGDNGRLFDWVGASPFRSPYAFGSLILAENGETELHNSR